MLSNDILEKMSHDIAYFQNNKTSQNDSYYAEFPLYHGFFNWAIFKNLLGLCTLLDYFENQPCELIMALSTQTATDRLECFKMHGIPITNLGSLEFTRINSFVSAENITFQNTSGNDGFQWFKDDLHHASFDEIAFGSGRPHMPVPVLNPDDKKKLRNLVTIARPISKKAFNYLSKAFLNLNLEVVLERWLFQKYKITWETYLDLMKTCILPFGDMFYKEFCEPLCYKWIFQCRNYPELKSIAIKDIYRYNSINGSIDTNMFDPFKENVYTMLADVANEIVFKDEYIPSVYLMDKGKLALIALIKEKLNSLR